VGNKAGVRMLTDMQLGDDPKRRQPDISRARNILNWEPTISLEEGLKMTVPYFKKHMENVQ